MTAPVPLTLDELLHAVVEACVQEITAARQEVAIVRAATAAERRDLEAMLEERDRSMTAQSQEIARLERDLASAERALRRETELRLEAERDVTKAAKVGSGSEKREAVPESGKPPAPRAPTVERSTDASSPAPVQRQAVGAPASGYNPRPPAEDLTGERIGSYVCEGRSGERRADGRVIWTFRCEACKAPKQYSINDFRRLKKKPGLTCPCQRPGYQAPTARRGRPPATAYKPEHDGTRADDEDLDELDTGDTDALLSRAMRESEGDGFIRRALARPAPRRPERETDADQEDGEREPAQDLDEDADDVETEELDFE